LKGESSMTYPGQENLPPLQLTTARWFNDYDEMANKWSKIIAHTGPYEQYRYGTDTEVSYDRWKYLHEHHPGLDLQVAIICSPWSGVIGIDIDQLYSRWGQVRARGASGIPRLGCASWASTPPAPARRSAARRNSS
jgi:hypothetical protein